jgi:hypothetical protein
MSEANWMMQELHPAAFQTTTIPSGSAILQGDRSGARLMTNTGLTWALNPEHVSQTNQYELYPGLLGYILPCTLYGKTQARLNDPSLSHFSYCNSAVRAFRNDSRT